MARVLGRSRSMRLRSSPKESQSADNSPVPTFESYMSGPDGKTPSVSSRADSAVNMTRPRTASGDSKKSGYAKHIPIKINSSVAGFDFTQPSPVGFVPPSSEDNTIGMALGSPTQASTAAFTPHPVPYLSTATTTIINADYPPEKQVQPKPKISRWKSIFGKKHAEPAPQQSFYLAQPLTSQQHLGSKTSFRREFKSPSPASSPMMTYETDEERRRPKSRGRAGPEARKKTMPKSVPFMVESPRAILVAKAEESPRPPPQMEIPKFEKPKVPEVEIPKVTISSEPQALSPSTPPVLDIDIPKIEMERYSVMFGSLLNSNRNSSLLLRRHGNPEKLKHLDERSLHPSTSNWKPQRRATSPTVKRSALSLFPPLEDSKTPRTPKTPQRTGTLNRPRPLQRSRTLPIERSPSSKSFEFFDDGFSEGPSTAGFTDDDRMSPGFPARSNDRETMAMNALRKDGTWKPDLEEPSWEIINKRSRSPKKVLSPGEASTLTIVEAVPSAHVGVARKVSVSRARGMAHTLQPAISHPERLVDRKPLTPTLVELKNRKSQRVQIVDA